MICFPCAKINLGLQILGKRTDGFHEIESCLFPIPLYDVIEFRGSDRHAFFNYGIDLGIPASENLVQKAYHLMQKKFSLAPLEIHLIKHIPAGSGLGGGSSDAAFLIREINNYFALGLNDTELQKLAAQLGSDCPFFIRQKPAIAAGRGEITEPVDLSLTGFYLVLVFPDIQLSTAKMYGLAQPDKHRKPLKEIINGSLEQWKIKLINDFEQAAFSQFPALKAVKKRLYAKGAVYASMTGSGSSIYGIFRTHPQFTNSEFSYHFSILKL